MKLASQKSGVTHTPHSNGATGNRTSAAEFCVGLCSLPVPLSRTGPLGRAEALLSPGRAFLYEALGETWQMVSSGQVLSPAQRARLWLASTHAANSAKQAAELMFNAGGSASPYTSSGLERCVRDILAACQHVTLAQPNYEMAGQVFLGADVRSIPLLLMDNRDVE